MITADVNYVLDVDGRARFDAVDLERINITFDPVSVGLTDARPINGGLDLDLQGFRLYKNESAVATTGTKAELEITYLDEMCGFIQSITGAVHVRPQRDGMILRRNIPGGPDGAYPPARFAHQDFTDVSEKSFLELSIEHDGPLPPHSRMAIYQTWRVLSPPPQDTLLAVADARSVPSSDGVLMDSVLGPEELPSCFFESIVYKVNPGHEWYYYPDMLADEILVFKGYDTDPNRCVGAMHTAFDVPNRGPDVIQRESIEARFFAFYE